ncbi:MAG: choice-of-anchor I family protein [Pseudomonadota bacterium]
MLKRTLMSLAVSSMALSGVAQANERVILEELGRYETGVFDDGASEIVAYDKDGFRLYVINAGAGTVDILGIADPTDPQLEGQIDVTTDITEAGGINSVAVSKGLVAIAVENDDKQAAGWVAFYDTDGNFLGDSEAGALPDSLTFSPNGKYVVVANEGEPSDDYSVDPEGSITIIDLNGGFESRSVTHATFTAFNDQPLPDGLRAPRPFGATLAQDLEPEFAAVSRDSSTAFVTLQENNGVAVVDLASGTVSALLGLGTQDHSLPDNGLDASNEDGEVNIQNWPVMGLYMPDTINGYRYRGVQYYVTANEGDGREYIFETDEEDCTSRGFEFDEGECLSYIDETRVGDVTLNEAAFSDLSAFGVNSIEELQMDENLGRIKMVSTEGMNESGEYEAIYTFGTRSFTIWSDSGELVYDSGDVMEQVTSELEGCDGSDLDLCGFNSTNDENGSFDDRSDDKGPEPEVVVVGKNNGQAFAFVGLERVGGIMIFNVSDAANPVFVGYEPARDFDPSLDVESQDAGDLGPEGMVFIRKGASPIGKSLLVVGNEVSGTTTIYRVKAQR